MKYTAKPVRYLPNLWEVEGEDRRLRAYRFNYRFSKERARWLAETWNAEAPDGGE